MLTLAVIHAEVEQDWWETAATHCKTQMVERIDQIDRQYKLAAVTPGGRTPANTVAVEIALNEFKKHLDVVKAPAPI
ncbi:hypothetical protein ACHAQH_009809 [Verticillium albo-atrum]